MLSLPAPPPGEATLGALLRYWRNVRQLSQLELANRAEVSARHLCFLETGRAKPSREMVLRLGDVLGVPLREQNALLLAAGFAPRFDEQPLDAPALASVRRALDAILRQQEPFPAVVMNRYWDILSGNGAATRFFTHMLDGAPLPDDANVVRMMFDPRLLRPKVRNWRAVAAALLQRIPREAVGGVCDARTTKLIDEVLAFPEAREILAALAPEKTSVPVISIDFRRREGEPSFDFFSTVTTLGTPQDITLQELRIECFFPADAATESAARALRAG
jgi:transcriptional regulator with XRE-family HTH domain